MTENPFARDVERSLIEVAIESWRFMRVFAHVVSKLDAGESARYAGQLRYFQKRVEDELAASGLKLVNIEGEPYEPGVQTSALNIADFSHEDNLVVERMIDPIVMGPHGVRKQGTVMLKRKVS